MSLTKVVQLSQYCCVPAVLREHRGVVLQYWCVCSCVEAKDVVRKLLVVDPTERMTIDEALQHPWLQVTAPQPSSVQVHDGRF